MKEAQKMHDGSDRALRLQVSLRRGRQLPGLQGNPRGRKMRAL